MIVGPVRENRNVVVPTSMLRVVVTCPTRLIPPTTVGSVRRHLKRVLLVRTFESHGLLMMTLMPRVSVDLTKCRNVWLRLSNAQWLVKRKLLGRVLARLRANL